MSVVQEGLLELGVEKGGHGRVLYTYISRERRKSTHNILLRIKTWTQPHLYFNDTKIKLEIYSNGAAVLQAFSLAALGAADSATKRQSYANVLYFNVNIFGILCLKIVFVRVIHFYSHTLFQDSPLWNSSRPSRFIQCRTVLQLVLYKCY